jgi:hypothetical protein
MKKVFFTALLVFLFGALWPTLAKSLPLWLNVMFLPPIILCFGMQYFRSFEKIFLCLITGFIVDTLGGFPVGLNMLIMLGFSFLLGISNMFSGRISRLELSYYVVAVSFFYRLALLALESTLIGEKNNIFISHFILGPLVDGLLSIVFYFLLVKILSVAKAMEHTDSLRPGYGAYS